MKPGVKRAYYRKTGTSPKTSRRQRADAAPAFKPGADRRLKQVFGRIGVPAARPFAPDAFQSSALAVLERADCLVTAPTGSGKTWIATQAMARVFQAGGRCWYASPLKALTNAKYIEFGALFGSSSMGILTGDRKENTDAPLLVGTTEILRNQLYDAMERGESLNMDLVVLDEAHFLGDNERGVVWEEIMIYLPSRIPLLLLSATIGNAHEIAAWLAGLRAKPCEVVAESRRPVPLFPMVLHPGGTLLPLVDARRAATGQVDKRVRELLQSGDARRLTGLGRFPPVAEILGVLNTYNLLPAIFFMKSRADCDRALEVCAGQWSISPERSRGINAVLDTFSEYDGYLSKHRQIPYLLFQGLGAHHSGQLPNWKLVIENLMSAGYLDAVFATSTVAAGVDFPARTIVFLNSDRFNGHEFQPLNATEYHQMTGRAGRRGKDRIGFALAVPGPFMDLPLCARLVNAPPAPVTSQIRINFSMALNLLLSHSSSQIEDLLDKSLAAYQFHHNSREGRSSFKNAHAAGMPPASLTADFYRHLRFLQQSGYVDHNQTLTEDGRWASQLRVDQPLLLAEGLRRNAFPENSPALMAGIMSIFVNERLTDDKLERRRMPSDLLSAFKTVQKAIRPLIDNLIRHNFRPPALLLRPAVALHAWAGGQAWEEVLEIAQVEEGDLAMLVMRTADNLRQVRSLAGVFSRAARSAARGIELILRSPVIMPEDLFYST